MEKGIVQEWLVIISFFLVIFGVVAGESCWLKNKGWASFGKSAGFSVITNLLGFAVGGIIFFIVLAVVIGMTWDGIDKYPTGFTAGLVGLVLAALLIPLLLILGKRVFLAVFNIQRGKSAWFYALISSLLIFPLPLGVPVLLGYILFR